MTYSSSDTEVGRCCGVCRRRLDAGELGTCVQCLGRVRGDLAAVVDAYALLPEQLVAMSGGGLTPPTSGTRERPLPGGDALVLLAGGNLGGGDPSIEQEGDPQPPVSVLAAWEDDWRALRGQPAARRATMTSATAYLHRELGWAAANHPAFADFAGDVRRLRRRLEAVVGADEPLDKGAGIACPECGEQLVRRYAPARPCTHDERPCGCDQGGRVDEWVCPNLGCRRTVTDREYGFAVWAALEGKAR